MPKTILIVGAGFGQLPAIEKAKELGHKVIVVDKNPYALGMPLADIAITVDIVDIDEVVAVAKQYHVDGVMTMQSDIAVPAVGAVVDALNLSGVGLVVANRCSNKIEARERFKNAGVPQPAFQVITTMQEAQKAVEKIGLPCVIKAPDSSGSRGVVKVCKTSEIESAFQEAKQYSRIGKLLVEEFIDGEEIGAQTFSLNGKCVKVLVHNDTISEPPYMVPIGHSFPAHLPGDIIAKVETACAKAVDAIGINSGPANVDLILGEDGRPMIIEIGARIGATCLPELVKYHTGIDWVEQTIKNCLGESVDLRVTTNTAVAAQILESPKDGRFRSVTIPDEINDDNVFEWEVTVKPGDTVNKLRKGTDRIGKVIVKSDNVDSAERYARDIKSKFDYVIESK